MSNRKDITCAACNTSFNKTTEAIRVNLKKNGVYLCHKCACKKAGSDGKYSGTFESRSKQSKKLWGKSNFRSKITNKSVQANTTNEYKETQSARTARLWQNGDYKQAVINGVTTALSAPEVRSKISDGLRKKWQDDDYRELITNEIRDRFTPQFREYLSQRSLQQFSDPAVRAELSNSIKLWWNKNRDTIIANFNSQEYKDKISVIMCDKWANDILYRIIATEANRLSMQRPEVRQKISKVCTELWKDSDFRTMCVNASTREDVNKRRSESVKLLWTNDEYRKRMSEIAKSMWVNAEYREKMAKVRSLMLGRTSQPQLALYQILDDLKVVYYKEGPDTHILKQNNPFDCVIPSNDLSKRKHIIIEVQSKWHLIPRQSAVDSSKFTSITRYFPDYKLMYIWDYEFGIKDQVIARLKEALNIDVEQVDFNLSDVVIKNDVPANEYRQFLDTYHYIGKGRGGHVFGAYLHDKLIACAVFSRQLRQNTAQFYDKLPDDVYELSRYCIHPCYHKKNFASWMISRLLPKFKGKFIISYADTTAGHVGTIYKAVGFQQHHIVPADYWYVSPEKRIMHKRTLYGKAKSYHMTESEFAEHFGYVKIFGYEKICYIKQM